MKIKLLVKKIKHKIIKFLYEYFKQNLKIINIKELWQVYMKYLMIFFAYLMM